MHTLLPPLANVGALEALIPITLFMLVFGVVFAAMYFKNRSQKQWHETARIALEKGLPIPAGPVQQQEAPAKPSAWKSIYFDVRAGLVLIALAVSIYYGTIELRAEGEKIPGFGHFIPGFIGVALLINALFTFITKKASQTEKTDSLPPKA